MGLSVKNINFPEVCCLCDVVQTWTDIQNPIKKTLLLALGNQHHHKLGCHITLPGHMGQQLPSTLMGSAQGSGGQLTVEQRV